MNPDEAAVPRCPHALGVNSTISSKWVIYEVSVSYEPYLYESFWNWTP